MSALYHLGQRELSSADLRRLLLNKVRRFALTLEGADRAAVEAEGAERAEAAVSRALREKLIDDARFSAMKVRGWRERGWGERRIAMEMRRKGLPVELAQDALREVDADSMDGVEDADVVQKEADRMAAETLCKRKRIGPFRKEQPRDPVERSKVFRREMGVLARAGFGGDVIRDMLGRPPSDEDGDVFDIG
jgi:SOS response regulatory protein OraA/RecX